jgi:hypothetical protein
LLSDLFGSQSAERVLLFLLVNERTFATEVQKVLSIPLTPLQSILHKFEKAGILSSQKQGKRIFYQFNSSYPLLEELKALLKKAFIHLSAEKKKIFFSGKDSWDIPAKESFALRKRKSLCLSNLWKRFLSLRSVSIEAPLGGRAYGNVSVIEEKRNVILFQERGYWEEPQKIEFTNTLRWSFDYELGLISLEHLRYGWNRPVFLFHLAPSSQRTLQSIDSHLCREDCYFGKIDCTDQHIQFLWRILGPKKNDTLIHVYK